MEAAISNKSNTPLGLSMGISPAKLIANVNAVHDYYRCATAYMHAKSFESHGGSGVCDCCGHSGKIASVMLHTHIFTDEPTNPLTTSNNLSVCWCCLQESLNAEYNVVHNVPNKDLRQVLTSRALHAFSALISMSFDHDVIPTSVSHRCLLCLNTKSYRVDYFGSHYVICDDCMKALIIITGEINSKNTLIWYWVHSSAHNDIAREIVTACTRVCAGLTP